MNPKDKFCVPFDLQGRISQLPRPLVMTNGVFDVLHRGHVEYLHRAAQLGASLLVAINTDASAQMLGKGPDRPLNKDSDRAFVIAGLSSVTLVTFFDTKTPKDLLKVIRPDIYVKGGDYDIDLLEETLEVRKWGGQSVAIPFVSGFSTTSLVQRIRHSAHSGLRKAAFIYRDTIINEVNAYADRCEDFEFLPGAIEGMIRMQKTGYALVIVNNQSGIASSYYNDGQFQKLTTRLCEALIHKGVNLDGVYLCPHQSTVSLEHSVFDCSSRKSSPSMLFQAAKELNISLPKSFLVGVKPDDIEAAHSAGLGRAYLVGSEKLDFRIDQSYAVAHYPSFLVCTNHLFPSSHKDISE